MKILTDKYSIALNQIAVQCWLAGILTMMTSASFVWFLVGVTNWTFGNPEIPLVEILATILLCVLTIGRMNSSERYSDTIRKLIKENSNG